MENTNGTGFDVRGEYKRDSQNSQNTFLILFIRNHSRLFSAYFYFFGVFLPYKTKILPLSPI